MPYDVITVGSATVDVFAYTERADLLKLRRNHKEQEFIAYPLGSKILINALHFDIGGGGTNCAVAFARLGLGTAYLGKIGNDNNAKHIIEALKKEKVKFIGLQAEGPSPYSVILDSTARDRTILTYKGVSDKLHFSEIDKNRLKTRWFYLSSLLEESYKTIERLAAYARKRGIRVSFNPSMYLARKGGGFLAKLLKNTDVIILNTEEAGILTGMQGFNAMLKALYNMGPDIAVITDGPKGAYCFDGAETHFIKTHNIRVLETTGAGDAFASSFIAGLIIGGDIKTALQMGLANAESLLTHYGAKNKLLTRQEMFRRIKTRPGKITPL